MKIDFQDKVVVVTGAAQGNGAAMAKRMSLYTTACKIPAKKKLKENDGLGRH
jgi:NAD(P)-dependent dehydrogenase (short-subunit alcohol dehydrogenase family)